MVSQAKARLEDGPLGGVRKAGTAVAAGAPAVAAWAGVGGTAQQGAAGTSSAPAATAGLAAVVVSVDWPQSLTSHQVGQSGMLINITLSIHGIQPVPMHRHVVSHNS